MKLEEIKKLAELSRLDMPEEEMKGIASDFDSILAYVDQVREVADILPKNQTEKVGQYSKLTNIMREDKQTDSPGFYADKIIDEMPETEGRYLKVKQVL